MEDFRWALFGNMNTCHCSHNHSAHVGVSPSSELGSDRSDSSESFRLLSSAAGATVNGACTNVHKSVGRFINVHKSVGRCINMHKSVGRWRAYQ